MADVTYVSHVKLEPAEGKIRWAYVPGEAEPVPLGVHSEVAEHYGVSPEEEEPHATTLDYLVAAELGADCWVPSQARCQRVKFPSTRTASQPIPLGR